MGKRLQTIRGKLGIPSGRALVHLAIVEVIINITWERVSKMFTVDYIREIGFLVVIVAGMFAVAWYLPKLAPIYTGRKTTMTPKRTLKRPQLIHDGVLWEDGGSNSWGNINVIGPLCPKDYTPLSMEHGGRIEARAKYDTTVSRSGYHSQLICLECHTKYTLGKNPKEVQKSHDEAAVRIAGMRKRGLENKAS